MVRDVTHRRIRRYHQSSISPKRDFARDFDSRICNPERNARHNAVCNVYPPAVPQLAICNRLEVCSAMPPREVAEDEQEFTPHLGRGTWAKRVFLQSPGDPQLQVLPPGRLDGEKYLRLLAHPDGCSMSSASLQANFSSKKPMEAIRGHLMRNWFSA